MSIVAGSVVIPFDDTAFLDHLFTRSSIEGNMDFISPTISNLSTNLFHLPLLESRTSAFIAHLPPSLALIPSTYTPIVVTDNHYTP